jgi:hypothetical protein
LKGGEEMILNTETVTLNLINDLKKKEVYAKMLLKNLGDEQMMKRIEIL